MFSRPLPWLLAAEAAILLALAFTGWHLVASRLAPPPQRAVASLPLSVAPKTIAARPHPSAPAASTAARAPSPRPALLPPGLSTNPAFWQRNLTQLNRDEAAWTAVEAHAAQAVEDFAFAYLQKVVLPAVEAAARR
jgi:hypothetical protein